MSALAALFLRDIRLAVRVGGGALIGVLFFLIVVTLVPFAHRARPRAAGADRAGDPVARRPAGEPPRRSTACSPPITRTARST